MESAGAAPGATPGAAPCHRGRTIALAIAATVVLVILLIAGAFMLGLWGFKGAVDDGALSCDMLVPFTGMPRPVPPPQTAAGTPAAPYDPELALAMIQFVSAAYGAVCGNPPPVRHRTPDGAVWNRVGTFVGTAAPSIGGGAAEEYGYAWVNTNRAHGPVLVLAFRGTLSLAGWIADFDFPQQSSVVLGAPAQVHRGFENLYLSMRRAVHRTVKMYPGARVLIAGHSLGGALATLAAGDLGRHASQLGGASVTTYTYGCPRVGDANFVRLMHQYAPDNWRIANRADAIPTVPPPGIAGYAYLHTPNAHSVISQQKGIASNHSLTGAYFVALDGEASVRTGRVRSYASM